MTSPYIQLQQATKSFQTNTVFEQLDLSLDKGEIMSIVGPSGSGKTTLLRCLAGLEPFTQGRFLINKENVTNMDANKRPVSLVFQQPLLFPHMTILENVAYGLTFQKRYKNERTERAQSLLQHVGLNGYERAFPHELSGGQQQRVSLARSLAIQPELLLLDEPFSSLDEQLRDEMRTWVRDLLKDQNITALFITHDREEAMYMGDRVGVFHEGFFQQIGEPKDVYQTPANSFVAEFFGDHLVIDEDYYAPLHSLFVTTNEPRTEQYCWEGIVKNGIFYHGNRFYQIRIPSLQKNVTLSSGLELSIGTNVFVTADQERVQSFMNSKSKE
ncbi:ABC transporter ATP-binding protein [Pontibacillus sp. HMF3514]|uniref:ABC transporter ATP-binding protein n=1 Tax=Pontibacillus sp. HMF3514 TaxID=2692425 RepID=UPI0013201C83|nr:ABC transporter ATP-binding protein [Pontibacillus sp. HMF3514]QHE50796.1 ATP-binding cassette domain-containing protein [Pontibacillus sp. HMF3514]